MKSDNIHLLFRFPVPEEDGFAGLLFEMTREKADLFAEAIHDATLLMTNRKFFPTNYQSINLDVEKNFENVIFISNSEAGRSFIRKYSAILIFEDKFIIELDKNINLDEIDAEYDPHSCKWLLLLDTNFGDGEVFCQIIVRFSRNREASINPVSAESFLKSLGTILLKDGFPDLITE